jgi:hypothetical protein
LVLQCIIGVSSNPVKGRTKIWQLKDPILTLFGLIFRCIYIYIYIHWKSLSVRQKICHSTKCLILYHFIFCTWCCFTNHFRRLYTHMYICVHFYLYSARFDVCIHVHVYTYMYMFIHTLFYIWWLNYGCYHGYSL